MLEWGDFINNLNLDQMCKVHQKNLKQSMSLKIDAENCNSYRKKLALDLKSCLANDPITENEINYLVSFEEIKQKISQMKPISLIPKKETHIWYYIRTLFLEAKILSQEFWIYYVYYLNFNFIFFHFRIWSLNKKNIVMVTN